MCIPRVANYTCWVRDQADHAQPRHMLNALFMAYGGEASGRDCILMLNFYFNFDFRQCSVCKILSIYILIYRVNPSENAGNHIPEPSDFKSVPGRNAPAPPYFVHH